MNTAIAIPDIIAGKPWVNLPAPCIPSAPATPTASNNTDLTNACCPSPAPFSIEAFKISGLGSKEITSLPVSSDQIANFRADRRIKPRQALVGERLVIFMKIDPALREELLHRDIALFPKEGILPPQLAEVIKKIGIGEERLARVMNLAATGRYTSEQNSFHSFCIPEHSLINQDLNCCLNGSESQAVRMLTTHLVNVVYNRDYTLVIHDGNSPTTNQLAANLRDGRLEYFKTADRMPDLTTLLKDIIEANNIAVQRVLTTFHHFKCTKFSSRDPSIVAAFKLVLADLQNYWITEQDPVSGMERLLQGLKRDCQGLGALFNRPQRYLELLENLELTTKTTHQLDRGLTLREDARKASVESRGQYISTTIAALGSAFLPNATVTQIPIANPTIQIAAHCIATILSVTLLLRMHKMGWFDFVSEKFGDLFGLLKIRKLIGAHKVAGLNHP